MGDDLTIKALLGLLERGSLVTREGYGCFGVLFTVAARDGSVPHAAEVVWADTGALVDAAPDELRLVLVIGGEPATASVDRLARWVSSNWSGKHEALDCIDNVGPCEDTPTLDSVLALRAVALDLAGGDR